MKPSCRSSGHHFILFVIFTSLGQFQVGAVLDLNDEYPQIETEQGWLEGTWMESRDGRPYAAFQGVPYATVPNRYDPPQSHPSWDNIRDAKEPGALCPQVDWLTGQFFDETEDCLFANIYVPVTESTAPLPVMLFLHGGGFMFGAGSFQGAHYLMEEDIILITINYRMGNFGFLSLVHPNVSDTKPSACTENNGLRDMIQALEWVRVNIAHFRGNPEAVTIAGESAGAEAVHALVLSPAATGLFARAIIQSGTMFQAGAIKSNPYDSAMNLATAVNCTIDQWDAQKVLACLKTKTTRQLLEADQQLMNGPVLPFHPTVEKVALPGYLRVLPDTPYQLTVNKYNNSVTFIPILIGCTQNEEIAQTLGILLDPNLAASAEQNWTQFIPERMSLKTVVGEGHVDEMIQIAQKMRQLYLGDMSVSNETVDQLEQMFSDYYCHWGSRKTAILHSIYGKMDVYHYNFAFPGKFSILNLLGVATQGVAHSDDLQYIFDYTVEPQQWPNLTENSADENFSKKFVHSLASFIQTGSPSSWGEAWLPIEAPGSTSPGELIRFFNLTSTPNVGEESQSFRERMEFWDTVFKLEQNPVSGATSLICCKLFIFVSVILTKVYFFD